MNDLMANSHAAKWSPRHWVGRLGWTQGLIGFLLLISLLEVIARSGIVHEYYFPQASTVIRRTGMLLFHLPFLEHLWATAQVTVIGLVLSIIIGVPAGVVLGSWKIAYDAAYALIEFVRPIPAVALIPVAIMVFGTGPPMKVVLIVVGAVWPILFNTIYATRNVDGVKIDTAASFGLSRRSILRRVVLPSVAPLAYTGVRISAAIALIIAISAEMLSGSQVGVGVWLMLARDTGTPPEFVFAGTLIAGLMGWFMNTVLNAGEGRMFPWQESQ